MRKGLGSATDISKKRSLFEVNESLKREGLGSATDISKKRSLFEVNESLKMFFIPLSLALEKSGNLVDNYHNYTP